MASKGWTARDLAKRVKRHETIVGRWLKGTGQPRLNELAAACDALGVSADWLLGREGAPTTVLADGAVPSRERERAQRHFERAQAEILRGQEALGRLKRKP